MRTQCIHQQYAATQVTTADRLQLVVMLYEGAIAFLRQAQDRMAARDASGKGLYLGKALDIIAELNASLNFPEGGEVAANLFRLYNFMTAHLTRANLNWDGDAVQAVLEMLENLKEAWTEAVQKARRGEIADGGELPPDAYRTHKGSVRV
ncbi:MAG: flagellar export chaperone FliS [Deltaproteobacteria bacterium]|nr:flagellar export chaperone FliS [Deltaproteobacteria bacterium]